MRFATAVLALAAGLLPLAVAPAQTPAPPPSATASAPAGSAQDAPAKHAKRASCLRQAKAKKLVGTQRKDFVAACVAAP